MRLAKTLFSCLLILISFQLHAETIKVAAAANLRYVLPELTELFNQQTGHQLAVSYAASGTLTTQLQHGAPFEVFLSASPDYIERLKKADLIKGEALNYAQAQLVLFAAKHSSFNVASGVEGLKQALEQGLINKVAIANPRHAPYGQIAQYWLEQQGLWQIIQPFLLMAENASQVVQFSLSSSVDMGFVPYAHIIQPQLAIKGEYIKLDAVLPQQAVLIRGASQTAQLFLDFLQSKKAQALFTQHGFKV